MTAQAAVTVSRDDALAVRRPAVDDKAQVSAGTAVAVAALVAEGPPEIIFATKPVCNASLR